MWPGFHSLVWKFFIIFTSILTWKTWKPMVVFMKLENQKIETWGILRADRPRPPPRNLTQSFNLFFCLVSWNHPSARCVAAKSVSWNHLRSRSRNLRFQCIWFSSFMKPPKVSSFPVKTVVKPWKVSKQVNETRLQQKKNALFLFKTPKKIWWHFELKCKYIYTMSKYLFQNIHKFQLEFPPSTPCNQTY